MSGTPFSAMKVDRQPAPLRQQVVCNIRDAITEGHFQPGARLVERELCEATGVSRTLVREALRQLETEGLVTVIPNRGPMVTTVELDEAISIYQVRSALEALACQLFASNASDETMSELLAIFSDFHKACEQDDITSASTIKNNFYRVLFEGSGNPVLQNQLSQIFARTSLFRSKTLSVPGRLQKSCEEIGLLVKALEDRDPQAAWKASQLHVASASKIMISNLSEK